MITSTTLVTATAIRYHCRGPARRAKSSHMRRVDASVQQSPKATLTRTSGTQPQLLLDLEGDWDWTLFQGGITVRNRLGISNAFSQKAIISLTLVRQLVGAVLAVLLAVALFSIQNAHRVVASELVALAFKIKPKSPVMRPYRSRRVKPPNPASQVEGTTSYCRLGRVLEAEEKRSKLYETKSQKIQLKIVLETL